jgi:hypothetical protein
MFEKDFEHIEALLTPLRVRGRLVVDAVKGQTARLEGAGCGAHINDCYKKYIHYYCGIDYLLPLLEIVSRCRPEKCPVLLDKFF